MYANLYFSCLIDTLDQTRAQRKAAGGPSSKQDDNTTFSAILGPFYRTGVPIQPNGTTIIRQDEPNAPYTHLFGVIHDSEGKPLPNAVVDIWHDAVSSYLNTSLSSALLPLLICALYFILDMNRITARWTIRLSIT